LVDPEVRGTKLTPRALMTGMVLGALLASILNRTAPRWSARYLLSLAVGLVAGESLFGVIVVWF
jgi:uncharacterized oligopeptide transporter (OPT) family protein